MVCHRGVALITGGAGGLGLEFARKWLALGGAHVKLVDMVSSSVGSGTASELDAAFGAGRASFAECDVTDSSSLAEAFAGCNAHGDLGLVINNAGIGTQGDFFDKLQLQTAVNLVAVMDGTRLALDTFAEQSDTQQSDTASADTRVIVNVASMAGLIPTPDHPVYTATKFGVVGFSRALHVQAKKTHPGVRVHALCPSFVRTSMMNDEVMAEHRKANALVQVFGGLMDAEAVAGDLFAKVVDNDAARSVLYVTPYTGARFDSPPTHEAEKAIRFEALKRDPIAVAKYALGLSGRKGKKK